MNNSVWAYDVTLPAFPKLEGNLKTDVLIIGGGLAGLLCAYQLDREGIEYALIEADRIASGVTRNTSAKITSQHGFIYEKLLRTFDADSARLYWQANEAALEMYRTLAKSVDCDFETKDNYIYCADAPEKLDRELAALEKLDIPVEFTKSTELPFPIAGAIRFRDQAQFHPLKFLRGIVGGLRIYEHTAAKEFIGNRVRTDRGEITASKIIVATHFPILNKHGGYFLKLYQDRSYVLAVENGQALDGMYLDGVKGGLSFRSQGDKLLIGGGGHRTGKQSSGWADLEAYAKRYYPQSREVCRWATQDCMTLDSMPYVGRYSGATPCLYVATGFNKWGMTSAMTASILLRDLVMEKENPLERLYSPSRSMLHPQLAMNVLESAVNLLTPTKPRCPHLGCALKWNPQEHSWDCPCHGSRFSEEGKLLDNPATGDIKRSRSQ